MPPRSRAASPLLLLNNGQLTPDCVHACVPCLNSFLAQPIAECTREEAGWTLAGAVESVEYSWVTLLRCQTMLGSLQDSHQHED